MTYAPPAQGGNKHATTTFIVGATAERSACLDLDVLLPRLVPAGLAGIETYYPGYTPEIAKALLQVADRWSLVATGGSYFHGWGTLTIGVGEVPVPETVVEQVRKRWQQTRECRMARQW